MVKGEKVKTDRDRDRHKGKSQPVQRETKMDGKRHEKNKVMREIVGKNSQTFTMCEVH